METVFLACAIGGGTILLCQFVMTLLGVGHHDFGDHHGGIGHAIGHHDSGHDHDHGDSNEHDSSWFVGILSFRTIVAALTFFGIAGKFGMASQYDPKITWTLALIAGGSAMFLVAWMMRGLYRLRSEGTARIERAVGSVGTVYLTVPPNKAGAGKVTMRVQQRTMEYLAVTSQPNEIPTGTEVVAVSVVGPRTVEVSPVPSTERVAHV
jgi:hypothetical protein